MVPQAVTPTRGGRKEDQGSRSPIVSYVVKFKDSLAHKTLSTTWGVGYSSLWSSHFPGFVLSFPYYVSICVAHKGNRAGILVGFLVL